MKNKEGKPPAINFEKLLIRMIIINTLLKLILLVKEWYNYPLDISWIETGARDFLD